VVSNGRSRNDTHMSLLAFVLALVLGVPTVLLLSAWALYGIVYLLTFITY
jgi:hypothetical protein